MTNDEPDRLIHDWGEAPDSATPVRIQDETLREGLQAAAARDPSLEAKIELLHGMAGLGIDSASVGLPIAGPAQRSHAEALCREAVGLSIETNCGGRTLVSDVRPMVEIAESIGRSVEACLFVGSSPIRRLAEDWAMDELVQRVHDSIAFASDHGLPVTFITEDTTRTPPDDLRTLIQVALDSGASRVCLCDTVGVATPHSTRKIVQWTLHTLAELGAEGIGVDWHGHDDRGLALANALAAGAAGADRIHVTALGLGERTGNTALEQLLVNLKLLGVWKPGLESLHDHVVKCATAVGLDIPAKQPIVGRSAFCTATGVHAAALAKARAKGEDWLADRIYSSVPAAWIGRRQEIEVGPLSGAANARERLRELGLPIDDDRVQRLLQCAKRAKRVLDDGEIRACVKSS